jgi:hypothetical protein
MRRNKLLRQLVFPRNYVLISPSENPGVLFVDWRGVEWKAREAFYDKESRLIMVDIYREGEEQ